jgi:hypothetical protein
MVQNRNSQRIPLRRIADFDALPEFQNTFLGIVDGPLGGAISGGLPHGKYYRLMRRADFCIL